MDPFSKKVFVKTYGCQMNVYDSERMRDVLAPQGYAETDRPEEADLVILNTCHIREKAAEKVYSELGKIRRMKQDRAARGSGDGRSPLPAASPRPRARRSCAARRAVDLVFGPQTYHRLPAACWRRAKATGRAVVETEFPAEDKFDKLASPQAVRPWRHRLSHRAGRLRQVLHLLRGALYARRRILAPRCGQVVAEARKLAARGVREITLLGQNVNAYHGEGACGHRRTSPGSSPNCHASQVSSGSATPPATPAT